MRTMRLISGAALIVAAAACKRQAPQPPVEPPAAPSTAGAPPPGYEQPPAKPTPEASAAAARVHAELPSFADLAEQLVPAVVAIQVEQKQERGQVRGMRRHLGQGDDPFEVFPFGSPEEEPQFRGRGLGSGFVIEANGLILTNAHVVEDAERIEVTFSLADGSEKAMEAQVLGAAREYDVALIKTREDAKAVVAPLGDSDVVRIGDWVMAIGNPFGLSHSVSVGIISAKQRREVAPSGRQGLYDFLQTDASINPGNSGGPLLDLHGKVIGINSAINAQGQGIGFAIPINMVKAMLPSLREGGRFVRSWLGVRIQPLTDELAQSYGLPDTRGVLVAEVVKGGPAARAGMREGDVVLEFDGQRLLRSGDLPLFASMAGVGKTVPVVVWRDKQRQALQITLEAFPEEAGEADPEIAPPAAPERLDLGLSVTDLTPRLRAQLDSESEEGAVIIGVEPGSAAARAGLRRGDVVIGINGKAVDGAKAVVKLLEGVKAGGVARMQVERGGARVFVALRKP